MARLATAALAVVLLIAGCGDDEGTAGADPVPAAGELAQTEGTPGVPSGAPYDVTGTEWLELEDLERFEAAQEFVADNPAECRRAGDEFAAADPVRDYADATLGTDYPLTAPVAELLAEGCAAALQSGDQDLAHPAPDQARRPAGGR